VRLAAPEVRVVNASIELVLGRDTSELAAACADRIAQLRRQPGAALAPVEVVAAHRAMREWLALELARQQGASIHLLWRTAEQVVCGDRPRRVERTAALFQLLATEAIIGDASMSTARSYIERESTDDRRALRRYRLAARVARAFAGYEAHAPELLARWSAGDASPAEAWQALLWRQLAPTVVTAAIEQPADEPPLILFDLPLPGYDLVEAVRRRRGPVFVLQRQAAGAQTEAWRRHARPQLEALERWRTVTAVPAADPTPRPLPTVSLVSAPDDRRACEAAVSQLWRWVRESPAGEARLRFHELAVMIPAGRRDDLLPVLREAMLESHDLPKVLWNLPLGGYNPVASLVRQLLDLPTGPMRRAEVVNILRHPLVSGAHSDALPGQWADWLASVGVFHGRDAADLDQTYLRGETAIHWDQGLTRLALGAFMGGARSGAVAVLETPSGRWLAEEVALSSQAAQGTLLQMARSLLSDGSQLMTARLTAVQWAALLNTYLRTYVQVTEKADRQTLGAVLGAVGAIAESGLDGALPYAVVRQFAHDALDRLPADVGAHLTQAIVVGTPEELRGLPWRRVVMLGLEAGAYPAKSRRDELDLRTDQQRAWDDPRRKDQATFVELLHATREEACLIRVGRNTVSNERIAPSLLLLDLADELAARGQPLPVDQAGEPAMLPLRRRQQADDPSFAWAFPEARAEAAIHALGQSMGAGGTSPVRPQQAPASWRPLLGAVPAASETALPESVELSIDDIVLFLQCPAQGYGKFRLRLRNPEDDAAQLIDEPLSSDDRVSSALFKATVARTLLSNDLASLRDPATAALQLGKAYEREVSLREGRGELPLGLPAALQRESLVAAASEAVAWLLDPENGISGAPAMQLRWGRATGHELPGTRVVAPVEHEVVVGGRSVRVRITGSSSVLLDGGAMLGQLVSTLACPSAPMPWRTAVYWREGLRGWVESQLIHASLGVVGRGAVAADRKKAGARWDWREGAKPGLPLLDAALAGLLGAPVGFLCPSVVLFRDWGSEGAAGASTPESGWQASFAASCAEAYAGDHAIERTRYSVVPHVDQLPLPSWQLLTAQSARHRPYLDAIGSGPPVFRKSGKKQDDDSPGDETSVAGAVVEKGGSGKPAKKSFPAVSLDAPAPSDADVPPAAPPPRKRRRSSTGEVQ